MNPTPTRPRRDFLLGMLALALVGFALALPTAVAVAAEEQDSASLQAESKKVFKDRVTPFLNTYCTQCHGLYKMEGGITFVPALKTPGVPSSTKLWNQAVANVKAHDMPPEDSKKQPTDEERQMFVDWVGTIKFLSPKDPGVFVIRRLTKVEYGNTLRDLFGVAPAVAAELPDEVFGEGYLNSMSPLQSEKYLAIANEVLERILHPKISPPRRCKNGSLATRQRPAAISARLRKRSRASWPGAPIAGQRPRQSWSFCCESSIWHRTTILTTRSRSV